MEAEVNRIPGGASEGRVLSSLRANLARWESLIAPAGLVLSFAFLGLILRLARLDFQPLWWDEGYSAWFATHSLAQMVRLTAEDIHPPLYYALLHAWTLLAGAGPVSLRLMSVAIGVAAIPLMYVAAARILGSKRIGLLAAFLLAINSLQVYYSQEVRMYELVALLSLGVLWAAWEVFARADAIRSFSSYSFIRDGRAWAYVALVTLALYTQYYTAFLPIGLTIFAAWHWRRAPKRLPGWFGLQAISALLYLPWVIYAGPRLTLYVSQKVVQDADKPLGLLAYFGRHLSVFIAGHLEGGLTPWWPAALLLLFPVAAGLILGVRRSRITGFSRREPDLPAEAGVTGFASQHHLALPGTRRDLPAEAGVTGSASVLMPGTVLVVALFLGWLIGLRYPFFPDRGERLLLLASPAYVMLAAAGLDALIGPKTSEAASPSLKVETSKASHGARPAGYLALILFVALSAVSLAAFYTVPRYPGDDYRPLIARAVEQGLPGDTVFAVYPWQVGYWRSYAGGVDGPEAVLSPSAGWGPQVQAALDEALERGRVWFPAHLALGAILETQVENYLASHAIPFANTWYGPGTRLSAWQASPSPKAWPSALAKAPIAWYEFGGGVQLDLAGVFAPAQPVAAANAVAPVALAWQANVAPPELAVSVRLVDDLGQIWAQNDYEPLGAMVGTAASASDGTGWHAVDRFGLLVPAGTPPGRYRLELVVLPKAGERPLVARSAGAQPDNVVRLFELEVTPSDRQLTPDRLAIAKRQPVDLVDGLRFLGYTVDRRPLAPGAMRRVNLFWQATGQPGSDYTAFVQLLGKDGAKIAAWEAAPGAAYPTSQWTAGTLIRTQAYLRPGAEAPDGRYRLIAGMYRPADGARLKTNAGKDQLELGALTIQGRPHEMQAAKVIPGAATPVDATFGQVARLVSYDGPPAAIDPAESVKMTLYWQASGATEAPHTVFVHVIDEQTNMVIGYGDDEPGNGVYPTTGWLKGEYLADPHTALLSGAAVGGRPARIEVGLYDPATGQRLMLPDGSDSLVLWRGKFGQ